MYIFVRVTAILFIILGLVVMAGGAYIGINGWLENEYSPTPATSMDLNGQMIIAPFDGMERNIKQAAQYGSAVIGAFIFFQGLLTAALGQLSWIIADIGINTKKSSENTEKSSRILQSFKK